VDRTKTVEIWEAGDKEEILKLKEHLRKIDNGRFLIVHRTVGSGWERYLKHHTIEDGHEIHPITYTWDGYIYGLDFLQ